MSTNILPFRRDLTATLARLVNLNSKMSAQELLSRHTQIINLRREGYEQMQGGLAKMGEIEPVTNALHAFHAIAKNSGIPADVIKAFNLERLDWKAFAVARANLPKCRQL